MKRDDFLAETARKVIALMETHGTGWTRPWADAGATRNAITGHVYSGMNVLLTGMACADKGYPDPRFLTFRQAQLAGAAVRKGEKGTHIMKVGTFERETDSGDRETGSFIKAFCVFNVAQVDGLEIAPLAELEQPGARSDPERDAFFSALGIAEGEAPAAFYRPSADMVFMPPRKHWLGTEGEATAAYYATRAHEYVHATGHRSRLDRLTRAGFGSTAYAEEELVAELGAAMLMRWFGLSAEPRADHAKYLNGWITRIREKPRAIFDAAAAAQRAVTWMIDRQPAALQQPMAAE